MRPEILYPLFAPVTALKGVGARFGRLVEKAAGARLVDLIWHLPTSLIDRSHSPTLAEARPGEIVTVKVTVEQHQPPSGPRQPWAVRCFDGTGFVTITFFHVRGDWVERALPVGETRVVSGRLDEFNGRLQMSHPDHIGVPGEVELTIEPVYPLTAGLSLKIMRRAVEAALARAPEMPEWLDPALLARERWAPWRPALVAAHHPGAESELSLDTPARRRLAYDEVLADQLALALVRAHERRQQGRAFKGDGRLADVVRAGLPFRLTQGQEWALAEILGDLAAPRRMSRLLQGDVGSGKTVVALLAMLAVIEAGSQAAMMAPTELLARQHATTLAQLAAPAGIEIAILTGREKGRAREAVLERLASGVVRLVVGTHALFQDEVAFADLGLVVIDEQHRFGVEQRVKLGAKGARADCLVMTATPIPRTLLMTAYGDLDVSVLAGKPAGRQPVRTTLVSAGRIEEVLAGIARARGQGDRVFWVCPIIEESETLDLIAAEARHALLVERFGADVGLLHGRMKPADRDRVMAEFVSGALDILVATTVIEVGVDVPEATVMVIDHAERFGLAQLHQLRGRVGRGTKPAACVLLYQPPLGPAARARLTTLRETDDGFRIAEADLRIRGAGEMLGTKQSGLPGYRLAPLPECQDLLDMAHDEARLILARDPELATERGRSLRVLLYLFERDAAVRYLRSG